MSLPATKPELRAALRAARRALAPAVREAASRAIATHVAALVRARPHPDRPVVAAYAALGSEVDPAPLVAALAADATFAWPRVVASGDRATGDGLTFHVAAPSALAPGWRGLREPLATAPRAPRLDVVLVPGLAFDATGRRLGQGGGFYDRALAALRRAQPEPPLIVGLAFAVQLVAALPAEPHDARVDLVATEAGVLACRLDPEPGGW